MKLKKLSNETHKRVLGWTPQEAPKYIQKQVQDNLAQFGLDNAVDSSELVELELPEWLQTYDMVAAEAVSLYGRKALDRLTKFSQMEVPELPSKPSAYPGWQRCDLASDSWKPTSAPKSTTAMVLDFETVEVGDQWYPVCCVVLTADAWYIWQADLEDLQSTIDFNKDQVIIGHNVPYDRSFLKPEYSLEESGNLFFDTMSAWIAARGFCNQQRVVYKKVQEDQEGFTPGWANETSTNGLDAVYEFYTGQKLDKGVRDALVNQGLPFVRQCMADVVWYCLKDVLATFEVFRYVYPEWRNSQPSEVSQTAQLLLGNTWLPLSSDRFPKYYDTAEAKYQEIMTMVQDRLKQVCLDVLDNPSETQLEHLDWTPAKTGKTKGLPKWFRDCRGAVKITERLAPILLGVTWMDLPVYWGVVGFDDLGNTLEGWRTSDCPVPHPEDAGKRVTQLFAKGFETYVEKGALDAPGGLKELLQAIMSGINWKSLRDRVEALKVEDMEGYPVCLPRLTVTGTVTRRCADNVWQVASNPKAKRIGTELKSMIEAPEGYSIVGADVDS